MLTCCRPHVLMSLVFVSNTLVFSNVVHKKENTMAHLSQYGYLGLSTKNPNIIAEKTKNQSLTEILNESGVNLTELLNDDMLRYEANAVVQRFLNKINLTEAHSKLSEKEEKIRLGVKLLSDYKSLAYNSQNQSGQMNIDMPFLAGDLSEIVTRFLFSYDYYSDEIDPNDDCPTLFQLVAWAMSTLFGLDEWDGTDIPDELDNPGVTNKPGGTYTPDGWEELEKVSEEFRSLHARVTEVIKRDKVSKLLEKENKKMEG